MPVAPILSFSAIKKQNGGSLMSNLYDENDIERKHKTLIQSFDEVYNVVHRSIYDLDDDDSINELYKYVISLFQNHTEKNCSPKFNTDRAKAFLFLFSRLSTDDDARQILSYFESGEFGWHDDEYYLSNSCLRRCLYSPEGHCKKADKFPYVELAGEYLEYIHDIFYDKDFGTIILFLFNYCLASLFSSLLNRNGISSPFFLQVACDRNSALYQVITEIIEICDVNSGLFKNCNKTDRDYKYCGYTYQTYYPTQSAALDIENLIYNFKDSPVLVSGHENERNYHILLREIANTSTKKTALGLKNRFNLLPMFVCPVIKSSFDNVFNMDLTDLEISNDYLFLIKKHKQLLSSLVLKLVMETDKEL